MQLYLLRHGEAEGSASSDAARRLTAKGHRDVKSVARQFRQLGQGLDLCLCSPYLRARETAQDFLHLVAPELKPVETQDLTPDNRAATVMAHLDTLSGDARVLLVGHNPVMSELHGLLVEGSVNQLHIMSTSELAAISIDVMGLGMGTLTQRLLPGPGPLHD